MSLRLQDYCHYCWLWTVEMFQTVEISVGKRKECSIGICQLKLSLISASDKYPDNGYKYIERRGETFQLSIKYWFLQEKGLELLSCLGKSAVVKFIDNEQERGVLAVIQLKDKMIKTVWFKIISIPLITDYSRQGVDKSRKGAHRNCFHRWWTKIVCWEVTAMTTEPQSTVLVARDHKGHISSCHSTRILIS